jgi:thiol-disulfide isomerase/thioredoxin
LSLLLVYRRDCFIVLSIARVGCAQQPPAPNPQTADNSAAATSGTPEAPPAQVEPAPAVAAPADARSGSNGIEAGRTTTPLPVLPPVTPATANTTPATATPDSAPAAEPTPDTSEQAKEILARSSKFYQGVNAFKVTALLSQKFEGADDLPFGSQETKRTITFAKPNKGVFRILNDAASDGTKPEDVQVAAVSDGRKLNVLAPGENGMRFARSDAPSDFLAALGETLRLPSFFSLPLILGLDDPAESLMEGVTSARYVGEEQLGEVKAHHLSFVQPDGNGDDMQWDLWIAAEGNPLVLQIVYDRGEQRIRTPDGIRKIRISIVDQLKDWEIDPALPEDAFVFTAPEGAKRVRSLTEPEPSPLLGKAAPAVKLALLKEGELDLASHAGKDVVMLDFWATWCGPCVMEMPILAKVAKEYADKGVVLYAVNLREETPDIEEFFKDKDFTATVALDTEGAIADAYGAEGIPHLVIIDRNGVVQSVHTGYSPDIEETLHKELDAILAGVNVYEELLKPLDDEPAEDAKPAEGGNTAPAAETSSEGAAP